MDCVPVSDSNWEEVVQVCITNVKLRYSLGLTSFSLKPALFILNGNLFLLYVEGTGTFSINLLEASMDGKRVPSGYFKEREGGERKKNLHKNRSSVR